MDESNNSSESCCDNKDCANKCESQSSATNPGLVELVATLQKQLAETNTQLNESRERYLRSVAEFDNYRKRVIREREDARTAAVAGFLGDLLPAFDTFARGIESARLHHPEAKVVIDGIAMIQSQINGVLSQNGVVEIAPAPGDAFNPNLHESVAHAVSDTVPEGNVTLVVRSGCIYKERLVRPASVVVSSGAAK
ncbi:MAG: nucleotide exchange factor GrpE [Verrucomicrobiota bacterium]|nr:nucleotide exchange factor GrpE [Verrucomicrobiota bacterium]